MNHRLTNKEKETIKVLYASGKTYYGISQEIMRSPHSVKKFLQSSPGVIQTVKELKQELADMFEALSRKMIDSITDADITKINAYQRTVAAGISIDKMRLLRDQSTDNISLHMQILTDSEKLLELKLKAKSEGTNASE